VTGFDENALSFDVAITTQTLSKRLQTRRVGTTRNAGQIGQSRNFLLLLRLDLMD
jgi:hypothetical protein